jgi:hypothetical protein
MYFCGWLQVLAGLAPSRQTVGSLLRASWPARKIIYFKMYIIHYVHMPIPNGAICRLLGNSFLWANILEQVELFKMCCSIIAVI